MGIAFTFFREHFGTSKSRRSFSREGGKGDVLAAHDKARVLKCSGFFMTLHMFIIAIS